MIEQLLVAGNETTTSCHSGMLLLLEQPEEMAKVRADPELVGNLVEEELRYESPVQMLFRTTTTDVEVAGVPIPPVRPAWWCTARPTETTATWRRPTSTSSGATPAPTWPSGRGPALLRRRRAGQAEARIGFRVLLDRLDDLAVAPVNTYERAVDGAARMKALHLTFAAQVAEKDVPG